jgi:hypothetical protein
MRTLKSTDAALLATCALTLASFTGALAFAQARGTVVVYEGARLILGDGRAPIENGAFVVGEGRISAVGVKGGVAVPSGAAHVDLTGKTVMPAMVNAHVHIGYEGYTSWGAANYTPQNVLDHLQREAYYGVGAPSRSAVARPTRRCGFSRTRRPAGFRRRHGSSSCPGWHRRMADPTMS